MDDNYLDQIVQQLDKVGFLNYLKASVRASVFRAVDNNKQNLNQFQNNNPLIQTIKSSEKGLIAIELIKDFLEHFTADQTLSIFFPEIGLDEEEAKELDKDYIAKKLSLDQSNQKPLLFQLIEKQQAYRSEQPTFRPTYTDYQQENQQGNNQKKGQEHNKNQQEKFNSANNQIFQQQTEQKKSKDLLANIQRFQSESPQNEEQEEISEEEWQDSVDHDMNPQSRMIFDSAATQSYGPDPSVGSLALEDYDYVEKVRRVN